MADPFLGWTTFALALGTFALAVVAALELREAQRQRGLTERSLGIAQKTLSVQQRPELVAFQREGAPDRSVHLAGYGSISKHIGEPWVGTAKVGVIAFEVSNIGLGPAEIVRLRVMSRNELSESGANYWQPHHSERPSIIVPAGSVADVDLVMAPEVPEWFYAHLSDGATFWVEVTYHRLGARDDAFVRWFEFQQRRYSTRPRERPPWYIACVLRDEPPPFHTLPPDSPVTALPK